MSSLNIQALLDAYPSLEYTSEKQKIKCNLTNHEMPASVSAIDSYVKGKKFKKALQTQAYNFDQHKPHIVPSSKKKHTHELFCTLTLRHIAKTQKAVERHVEGKRFQRALKKWTKCQETGEKFFPRAGGRKSSKPDSGSWSDDNPDDDDNDDDMSDLYPAEDFVVSDDDSVSNDCLAENAPPGTAAPTSANGNAASDSDYDMNILDSNSETGNNGMTQLKENSPIGVVKEEKKTKKKKKKRQSSVLVEKDGPSKKMKKKHKT